MPAETNALEANVHLSDNVEPPETPRFSRRKRWLFLLLLWCGLLGIVEAAARIYIPLRGYDLRDVRDEYARRRAGRLKCSWPHQENNHPYLPYHPRTNRPDVDMPGLRLTSQDEVKPPDVFRIFYIGGSVVYFGHAAKLQAALSDDFAARGLRLEVVNAANISWTTADSLANFALRCVHYEPDAIIVYHGANDAWPAFGSTYRRDYSHWRKRLVQNEALLWDYMPRFLDVSAGYVQLRAWIEGGSKMLTWATAMMHYVPDFDRDPYHGVESYRRNLRSLIGVARAHGAAVLLSTQVYNRESSKERLLAAIRETNAITRALAAEDADHVFLVDAAVEIEGDNTLMKDICHFRPSGDGEARLLSLLGQAVREHLDTWIAEREPALWAPDDLVGHQTLAGGRSTH